MENQKDQQQETQGKPMKDNANQGQILSQGKELLRREEYNTTKAKNY